MPTIQTARTPLFIKDYRKQPHLALPTVLIHGAGGTYLDWSIQMRTLPSLRAIAIDLPGHGLSKGAGRSHLMDYVLDVIALLDALEIEQCRVGGISMGGAIAQLLALEFPHRVQGLLLVGTGAILPVSPSLIAGLSENPEATITQLVRWFWTKGTPETIIEQGVARFLALDLATLKGDFLACQNFDVREQVAQINVPTLVVIGSLDRMTAPSLGAFLADQIPQAMLLQVAQGGHMMMLEQPEWVAKQVNEWASVFLGESGNKP